MPGKVYRDLIWEGADFIKNKEISDLMRNFAIYNRVVYFDKNI